MFAVAKLTPAEELARQKRYDEARENETRWRAERRENARKILQAVAMTGAAEYGWEILTEAHQIDDNDHVRVELKAGMIPFGLGLDTYHRSGNRISASIDPMTEGPWKVYNRSTDINDVCDSISVSPDRTPKAIAADIQRRLVATPAFITAGVQMRDKLNRYVIDRAALLAAIEKAKALGYLVNRNSLSDTETHSACLHRELSLPNGRSAPYITVYPDGRFELLHHTSFDLDKLGALLDCLPT